MIERVRRFPRAFADFWWDFLIGDTPEIFVAALAVVGLAYLLHTERAAAIVALPLAAAATLWVSAFRGRRSVRRDERESSGPGTE